MNYRAFLGVLAVLSFLVLSVLYTGGSLEAAGQGQTPQNSRPEFGETTMTLSVTENAPAGDFGYPVTATDSDNDTLRYSIITSPRGPFEIDPDTGQLRTTEPLNYEAMSRHQTPPYMMTSHYFYIGVSDGKNVQGYRDGSVDDEIAVEVNVTDVEEEGVVDLLWDRPEVGTPIVASLTDADGQVSNLTWQWTSSSSSICSSDDISGAAASSYTPQLGDNGKYLCAKASYTDRRDSGKTANAVLANPVQPIPSGNTAPTFTNTSATRSVRENTPSGTHLGDAFQATDADSDEIRYFLGGTDGGAFDIDPKTGQLKVKDPLNHESKETYSLSVFARDPTRAGDISESTGTVAVTITVTDINERPKVTGDFKPTYRENSGSLLVTTLTGVDEDEDGPFHQNYFVGWLIGGYAGSDGDFFYMDDDGDDGHLKFRVPPDFDKPADRNRDNVYNISMTAYTGEYDRTFFNLSVTVTDGNDNGIVVGPSSVNYPEGATRPVETYTISDTTQQTISWSVTGTDRDRFTIGGGVLSFKAPPDYSSPSDLNRNNKYSITVTAYGTNVTAAKNVVVTVTEHNFPPRISGPARTTFAENATGTVATYTATDEDNDTITWRLSGDDAGNLSIHSTDGTLTFNSSPNFEAPADDGANNDYEVTVQAYDGTDTVDHPVTVTVTNVNEAPSFGAPTATRTVEENTPMDQNIDAPVEATDVDANDSLTYSLDSDSTAVFDIDSNGQLKTKGALDHETKGSYSVIVTVLDTGSLSATIIVTIDVADMNDAPEFASAADIRSIPENTAGGTNIGDPVAAIDQDGDTLNYTLDGTDAGSFDIVATTGQLMTKAALDIESRASYSVTVAVRDNKDAAGDPDTADDDTITVTITVTQENEAPTFATQTTTREIAENTGAGQNIGTPVTATDEDVGDTMTYSLGGTDAASFDIAATSGQLQTKADLNHEDKDSYTVTVVATDVQGESDDIIVTIGVTDVNEPPTFPNATATRGVDENTATNQDIGAPVAATDVDANDSLTYSWGGGADDASFYIDMSTGQLKTRDALDHEAKDRYSVTVAVWDAAGLTSRIEVTIAVGDMNDAPKFLSETTTRSVPENTATDQNIGAVVEAKDEDDGDVVTYSLEGTDPNFFDIDTRTGQLKTSEDLDREGRDSYLVTVVATDRAGAEGRIDVTITVTDVNEAPKFPSSEDGARSIPESATARTAIGDAVEAEDPDVADTLTYTLGGTDANSFTIVTSTGQLQVKDALDFETKVSYEVTVSVRDSKDGSGNADTDDDDTITVFITVENSNEDIDLSGDTLPSYAENSSRGVATYTALDPESETIIWNLSGDDAALFDITGGVLTFDSPPDFEDERDVGKDNHYQVTIEASTATDAAAKLPVTIAVTDVNEPPEFPAATATREVSENTEANQPVGAPVEASDPDAGDSLTYALGGTHAASFDIDTSTGQLKTKAALDFEGGTTSYSVTVTASDTDPGTPDDTIDVTITVTDANDAPTFNSGLTTTISVPENTVAGKNIGVALTATDQDGDMLTYSLNTTSALVFDIDIDGQLKTKAALDHERTDSYEVTVSVADNLDGLRNSDTATDDTIKVTVNVTDVNEAPAFPSSEDGTREIAENTATGRDIGVAVAAEDPDDGDTLTYKLEGIGAASFDFDTSTGQIKTKDALDFETTPSYSLTVSVRDSKDDDGVADTAVDDTQAVTIGVTDENENVDLQGSAAVDYAENGTNNVAEYTASDPENTTIRWDLAGDDESLFDIVEGVLAFVASPDFEAPGDQGTNNKYQVAIEAYDDTATPATLAVTVSVTDVNEAPAFLAATTSRSVSESASTGDNIGDPVDANDPDAGATLTYTLGGTDAGSFSILALTGQLQVKYALDFETKPSHEVTVWVRDSKDASGNADTDDDDTITVTITVTDANDTPTFNSGLTTTLAVDENTVAGTDIGDAFTATDQDTGDTVTYSLDATSAAVFDINSNGQLKTKGPLDHETTAIYTVTVSVSDGKTADGTADTDADNSITVTVNVTDLVEDGTITLSSRQPQVGTAFTATLTDPAITPANDRWTWEKSTDKALWTVISTATTNAYTPVAEDVNNWLKVTATYNDGQGSDDKSAQAVSEFQVRDQSQSNHAPAFPTDAMTRSIVEGTGLDRSVGSPVTANDPDSSDAGKLTYTLSGTNVDSFDIDAATGQIKTAVPLDYDTKSSYTVNVTGTDPSLATDDVTVTITVTQAPAPQSNSDNSEGGGSSNSKPEFAKRGPEGRSVPENTAPAGAIGLPLTATDDDNDALTYNLGGADAASFDIDTATGQLKTKAALDHETKSSYTVTVSVHDGKNAAGGFDTTADDTVTVTITVTDVNEPPAFDGQTATREVAENTVAGHNIGDPVAASDQDTGDTLTYTLGGTDASAFDIDSTGQLKTKAPLDYETKNSYAVTVVVRDSKDVDGNADTLQDDSISVTINVIDLNEVATLTLSSLQPQVGIPLTATLNDPDGASNVTWAWEKSSDKSNWTTISGATSSSYTPVVGDVDLYLRVTAFYTDSNSSDKSAQALSRFAVRAEPSEPNAGPDFGAETANRSIVEGSAAGQNIGQPVTATDANAADGGKLTYTLGGTDGASFDIVPSSGQLLTKDPLVYATKSSHTVTVTATDPFRASDTITVTINVTEYVPPRQTRGSGGGGGGSVPPKSAKPEPEFDANGPVTITVPENTEAGTDIGDPLTATDDDDTVLTYSIIDWRDGSSFDIDSSTGQLKTKAPLDYETRTQYELQAKVHDDDGGDDRITVQVRVTGMPEAPTVTGDTTIQVAENSSGRLATYSATDPEGSDVTWDLSGDDAGDFAIANGGLSFSSTPDHENPADSDGDNVYHVTVEASDGTDSSTLAVTVTVTNLIDDFRVRGSTRGSATGSNAGSDGFGIAMTSLSYPENGTAAVATYVVVEPAGAQIGWSLAGDDGDLFSIDNGTLRFNDSPDYESPGDSDEDNAYVVAVQAADGTETASLTVTIRVTDVNEGPSVAGDSAVDYAEQGKGSVATYTADDPEDDDLDWSLSGGDTDAFSIEAGVLSFSSAPNFEEPSDSDKDNVYDVILEVSDGTYSVSADVSITVTDIQEVPITNSARQAVGTVTTGSETTIKTPDDAASVTFPASSRANVYMARVDSDPANCSAGSAENDSPGPNDGDLRVCLTIVIFDTWGNEEQDVTLAQPASVSLMMDADDLGGVEMVQQAYDQGGINIYTRGGINDEWSTVEFTLTTDEEGTVTLTVTGVTQFGSFAAATDADVFNQLMVPDPTPTPTPQQQQTGSGPVSMMSGTGVVRMPLRRPSVPMAVPAPSTNGIPPDVPPVAQVASVEPLVLDVVGKAPLWALIVLIMGSLMVAVGTGMVAYSRLTAPPPWMRVPGAPVKTVKRQAAFKSRV